MNPLIKYGIAVAAVMGALYLAYDHGVNTTADRLNGEHDKALAAITTASTNAVADEQAKQRKQEARHADEMASLDAKHHEELQSEIISKERAIADVRADVIRVRDEFTCPAATATGAASQTGTGTSLGDAANTGGLQKPHVEFLLREAGRADEVVKQLQACQAVVRGDRADASGVSKP